MAFAKVYAAQTQGLHAHVIDVEVDLSRGLNAFTVVGLPDKAVEEARDRIGSAIKNSGYDSPKSKNQKTIISLAPAHIKKEGPLFDLSMSLAYLLSAEDISFDSEKRLFLGELSLDGTLRPIKGALPIVAMARKEGFKEIYLPKENAPEAALIEGIDIFGATSLKEVIAHLNDTKTEKEQRQKIPPQEKTIVAASQSVHAVDFADVAGQESAKRGLEIAAAGGHNIAMFGPPGTGKTMLAKAFRGILPPLAEDEMIETTGIHSIAGTLRDVAVAHPPFRSPHHTSSYVSVVGGGAHPKPGEITLAHNGVLFLDEFPEFDRRVVEALRQPLEDGEIHVSRAKGTERFPANIILIAAMNPCPCGNFGSTKECVCTPIQLLHYQRKISGPIADRIDLWIEVGQVDHEQLSGNTEVREQSAHIKTRIENARALQKERFRETATRTNSTMNSKELEALAPLSKEAKEMLDNAAAQMGLSARAYHRTIKLARTIADLESVTHIATQHLLEALQYRPREQRY